MPKNAFAILFIFLSTQLLAANGDVIFKNTNSTHTGSNESIQFELLTNKDGIVDSGTLAPGESQIVDKWRFSDTTDSFVISIRNTSTKQMDYYPCSNSVHYQTQQPPINIEGWSEGNKTGCTVTY
jgi:hypothetical protein